MAESFTDPIAFKTSLEARLRTLAAKRGIPLNILRLKLVIERMLARLFAQPHPPWVLKGGYAMELRFRPRARTTRDIDLTCSAADERPLQLRLAAIRDQLQIAAETNLGDYLVFRIESARIELTGAPLGGARFPCEAFLAGKTYGRFHIDLGFGDQPGGTPETLLGDDWLAFARIRPAKVLAIPTPQQFAEKLHAYTRLWTDRINMRTKDLVDMVLLIETHSIQPTEAAIAVEETFFRRNTQAIPQELPDPPSIWNENFAALATEAQLHASTLPAAIIVLREFWLRVQAIEK